MMKSDDRHRSGRCSRRLPNDGFEFEHGVAALHRRQHAVGTRLHRQMQMRHQLGQLAVALDQPLRHLARMAGGVADALDAGNLVHHLQQEGEIDGAAVVRRALVGVDVLPQQGDFLDPAICQTDDLGDHVVERAREFLAARVGHDAEGAVFGAAFHDRHEGRSALDPRRRQVVELLDFGKADVDLGAPGGALFRDQLGQAVQGLRAEHHIDEGCARHDGRAFLRRHAAADADDEIGVGLLQVAHPAEIVEHLFLRLFAHRAGIEQDHVGIVRRVGRGQAFGQVEHVGHLVRVVLVHLTAEGFDVDFFHEVAGTVNRLGAGISLLHKSSTATKRNLVVMSGLEPPTPGL